jgi:hypothetical protein
MRAGSTRLGPLLSLKQATPRWLHLTVQIGPFARVRAIRFMPW